MMSAHNADLFHFYVSSLLSGHRDVSILQLVVKRLKAEAAQEIQFLGRLSLKDSNAEGG